MEFRPTDRSDLEVILSIYNSARRYMSENGNPNQWGEDHPGEKTILSDIENGHHFLCTEGDRILACFAFIEGDDPTYETIVKGKWLDDDSYGVIHRIAVLEHGRGIGSTCIEWCFRRCGNIRIDTHPDNASMRGLLYKSGFTYCGMIYNSWGDPRLAFQKTGEHYPLTTRRDVIL